MLMTSRLKEVIMEEISDITSDMISESKYHHNKKVNWRLLCFFRFDILMLKR
jgi:hypothetical protein